MTVVCSDWSPYETGAKWIFPTRPDDTVNQLVDFYHTFDASDVDSAELTISADTDFVVWLNGNLVGYGQYSDYPDQKTYERFAVERYLNPGRNELAITVFYNGRTSSVYRRGQAGLIYQLASNTPLAVSGTDTLCRQNPCYHSGPIAIVSGQLAYTFGYDARRDDGFGTADYTPGDDWSPISDAEATTPEARSTLSPRPIARLKEDGVTAAKIHSAGVFRRDLSVAERQFDAKAVKQTAAGLLLDDDTVVSPAWQMQHDYLSSRTSHQLFKLPHQTELSDLAEGLTADSEFFAEGEGLYLIVDMGQQEVGYLEFEVDAEEGTILDIGYGEHLDDQRPRTLVGGRNFAARYVCKDGRQRFTHHFLRWAGRYLSIHSSNPKITLHQLTLQRRAYPVTERSSLETGDRLHAQIIKAAQRTLACCMHEHYEDTPWREQALYANDARTQALCGYYAFGETAFPRSSFSLLGRGLRDDGLLYLTAPAMPGVTIPSFTFCWMLAVRDHYLYSGDDSLAREFLPQIKTMLTDFLDERENGLLPLRRKQGIWHFYDWSGMSGYNDTQFDNGLDADAPLNCFLILALEAAIEMARWLGETDDGTFTDAATGLRSQVAKRFWDADAGLFKTHDVATTTTQLTQALAVLADVGTREQRDSALAHMVSKGSNLIRPGLSQTIYTFSALMTDKQAYGQQVIADMEETWGEMLKAGATTFWETIKGAGDFHNAGSLCHAWSAVPVYVYYHDMLGVRPTAPGYKSFVVDPLRGHLRTCAGTVPTPNGEITVAWDSRDGKTQYDISSPSDCTFTLLDPDGIFRK